MKKFLLLLFLLTMSCYTDVEGKVTFEITGTLPSSRARITLVEEADSGYNLIGESDLPWSYSFDICFYYEARVGFSAENITGAASDMVLNIYLNGNLVASETVIGDGSKGSVEYLFKREELE